jgi:hypothetical protein
MGKNKPGKSLPTVDIESAFTPKHDLPTSANWCDILAMFALAIAALGLYWQSIALCAVAFFATVSLWINKPESTDMVPTSFVSIFFCAFLVGSQYLLIKGGHRLY